MVNWKRSVIVAATLGLAACSGAEKPNNDENSDVNIEPNGMTNGSTNGMNGQTADYTGLVINEVAASGDPEDWFELLNTTDAPIDLTGVTLSDDPADPAAAAFEDGTTIGAGEYMMFEAGDMTFGFKLGGDEELHIYDPAGNEIDGVDWAEGESPDFKSYGRFPNGTGDFKTLNTPTPGAENIDNNPDDPTCGDDMVEGMEVCDGSDFAGATCESMGFAGGMLMCSSGCDEVDTTMCEAGGGGVVINEVTASGDDNIELYNTGMETVDLAGWYVGDSGWDPAAPDEGHRYIFPMGTEIAAGEFLVLVKDTDHTFGIGGEDAVVLYDADDMPVDQTTWADGDADTSWCRVPDGDGDFQMCMAATFGTTNQ